MFVSKNNVAFTLAEVLVTLGIIGVVVSLTLPSLIVKQHQKVMEAKFKKSYSSLLQALYSIDMEVYDSLSDNAGNQNTEFFSDLYESYKVINNKKVSDLYKKNNKTAIKTYTKKEGDMNQCAQLPSQIAYDGSAIGGMYNCFANWIVMDTNGPKQGSNALGHDIFYFYLSDKRKIIPVGSSEYTHWEMKPNSTYCSKNSNNIRNGSSCAYFAVSNICPNDSSKTYWECLP